MEGKQSFLCCNTEGSVSKSSQQGVDRLDSTPESEDSAHRVGRRVGGDPLGSRDARICRSGGGFCRRCRT